MRKNRQNLKLSTLPEVRMASTPTPAFTKKVYLLLTVAVLFFGAGCKKVQNVAPADNYYGYGKIDVTCAGKCHVSFGTADKMNAYDIDANSASYSFRYQTKYDLDITITPTDIDQGISLYVYSREQKLIFHNTVNQKVNMPWQSTILVP